MSETRKLAAILAADVVGFSRLAGTDEDRTLARLRALRSDLVDPTIAVHRGRVVKRTGDGVLLEFRSLVDAVRCAIEVQSGMVERNAGLPPERRIEFRVGIHLGDVVEESDGDLMGDGVNIAARLEGVAEPGGICLSEDAYRQVRDKLKEQLDDLGEQSLKNIARPVRIHAVKIGAANSPPAPHRPAPEKSGPPRLSVVVLPFANISGDPEQEYFVDGVTESLTTDLSRISGSFVIARNTAYAYKGKSVDVRAIGRELNVRYVMEGSVQRGGARMRVNVQLIDAESGAHLWAERFDKPLADLFDMQDEIIAHLARQLDAALIAAEARRAAQAPQPDSIDLYFQGMAWANKGIAPGPLTQAGDFFKRALALDPDNVDALIGDAWVEMTLAGAYTTDDRTARLATAKAALTRALSLAPGCALAHLYLGRVGIFTNHGLQAIAECERALALDRNLAAGHATIGLAKIFIGRGEETEAHVREALRLSPRDTFAFSWMAMAGLAKLYLGGDEEAVAWFRRAIEIDRNLPNAHFYLAAALAHLGRLAEVQAAVVAGLAINPTYTINGFRAGSLSNDPTFLAQRERVYDGMRKAGVPEG
jgi:TolB-like protein/class 3 adenylate cyclase